MTTAVFLLCLVLASSTSATRPNTWFPSAPCYGQAFHAPEFAVFAEKTWRLDRWEWEKPKAKTIATLRHKLRCAAGPGHRAAMKRAWREMRAAFNQHRDEKLATLRWEPYVCGERRYALPCAVTGCESGFYFGHHSGAYGLLDSTWVYWGGGRFAPYPGAASPRQQAIIARRVWEAVGPSGWECPL